MTEDELDDLLRRWGRAYGEAPPPEWDEVGEVAVSPLGSAPHPLAVAADYAPGRAQQAVSVAYKRPRAALRRWSSPIACVESRHYAGALYFAGAQQRGLDSSVARVERAVMDLHRIDAVRSLVLRAQFCRRGTQREKTSWVSACGWPIKLRMYRDVLAHAKTWIHGRLA